MHDGELTEKQRAWAESGLMTLRELLPLMSPVSNYPWGEAKRRTIAYLLTATARSTESALLLCAYSQVWDAEIVVRSVLEGSLKFAYLLQSKLEFPKRHEEYAEKLYEIALFKDHRKAVELLALVPDPASEQWRPMREILLADSEFTALSQKYGKADRNELATRWGFTGLIGELSRSADPYFSGLGALAHGYAMASHVQHVDFVGASIALERDHRSKDRRDSVQLAHTGRLISDLLDFFFLRLATGYRFTGADREKLTHAWSEIAKARQPFKDATSDWMDIEYARS